MDQTYNTNPNALVAANIVNKLECVLDLRATTHLTNGVNQLYNMQPYYGTQQVTIENGELLLINQIK